MKERPILFSGAMVRAIIAGTKTQTRRVVKPQPPSDISQIEEQPATDPHLGCMVAGHSGVWEDVHSCDLRWRCPYGQPGDRLWVKETWQPSGAWMCHKPTNIPKGMPIFYAADWPEHVRQRHSPWFPSLFMRRWMSRLTLEIVSVRVERLQVITWEDAVAEGVERTGGGRYWLGARHSINGTLKVHGSPVVAYADLWDSINGPGSWEANPWVWVIEFKRVSES